MRTIATELEGVVVVEPQVHGDERGFFLETLHIERYRAAGIELNARGGGPVQLNHSRSARGTLRGLHFQEPRPQGKLVWAVAGAVFDVAVDVRRGSPTFGRWTAVVLSAENRREFWIPEGFAHGFVVLSERAIFHYLCTAPYVREADAGLRWNDASLAIDWPVSAPSLSEKDAHLPFLEDIVPERLPEYSA